MKMTETYNEKAFLLPDSINSCALYHAKVFADGRYLFRIHDCVTGIRLKGELNTEDGRQDALEKVTELMLGLERFRNFILEIYFNPNNNEKSNIKEYCPAEF